MIVTIDGPAGAGKSSVARELARRLEFRFLDTGAMYRAVALAALRRSVPWNDAARLAELAAEVNIELTDGRVLLDGQDVSDAIRTTAVTSTIHHVADNLAVRRRLVELQRRVAEGSNIVTEGRDQGTVVFPDAACKIFLTASPEERARRRAADLQQRGEDVSLAEVLAEQTQRDFRDTSREYGRLVPAPDAVEVLTDGLSPEQVVARLEQIVREKQK